MSGAGSGSGSNAGSSPEVSVVIPARNEADYLPATLDSFAAMDADCECELFVVDGDTTVRTDYLGEVLAFVRENDLIAASSRCRMDGRRSVLVQGTINRAFPRLRYPILPGFNSFVERETYERLGGFPNVPNEDTAFSRVWRGRGP